MNIEKAPIILSSASPCLPVSAFKRDGNFRFVFFNAETGRHGDAEFLTKALNNK